MAAATLAPEVGVAAACRALGVACATFYRRQKPTTGHQQPTQRPQPGLSMKPSARRCVRPSRTRASSTDLPQRLWPPSSMRVSTSAQSARCTGSSRRITPCVSGAVSSRIPCTRSPSSWPRHRTRPGRGTSPSFADPRSGRTSTSTSSLTSSAGTWSDGWSPTVRTPRSPVSSSRRAASSRMSSPRR